MIILMSISDRKNRVRTGKLVKKLISDNYLKYYLDNIKGDLRATNYTTAIDKLLTNILNNIRGENYYERFCDFLIALGTINTFYNINNYLGNL